MLTLPVREAPSFVNHSVCKKINKSLEPGPNRCFLHIMCYVPSSFSIVGNYALELRYLFATTAIGFLLKLLASLNQVFSHCENIPERLKSIIYIFFKLICGWLLCPWYLPHYSLGQQHKSCFNALLSSCEKEGSSEGCWYHWCKCRNHTFDFK